MFPVQGAKVPCPVGRPGFRRLPRSGSSCGGSGLALRAPAPSLFLMPETPADPVNDLVLASARIPGGTALYDVHVADGVVSRLAPAGTHGNPGTPGG